MLPSREDGPPAEGFVEPQSGQIIEIGPAPVAIAEPAHRVCMIVQSTYPNDERVRREAEALERRGIAVDVICLRAPNQKAFDAYGLIEAHRVLAQADKETLGQYARLSAKFSIAAFFKLQQLCMSRRYEVFQAHNLPDTLIFVPFFQKLIGRRLVLDLHDLSVELLGSKWTGRKAKTLTPVLRLVEKVSCMFADRVIATSEGFRERLIERGVPEEKITLVINTADPHIFKYYEAREFKPIDRGARLLYHGTVAERFGLMTAIEAIPHLQKRIPESRLAIYGNYDPSYKKQLERKIDELGMRDYVTLGGHYPLEEVYRFICNSDIGLVPYHSTDFMNLALSTKTFEYAATGLPVVASRLRPVQSVFGDDCVTLANPGDAADLAAKAAELCLDPERRRKQSLAAREALKNISGEVMGARYTEMMESLMPHARNGGNGSRR